MQQEQPMLPDDSDRSFLWKVPEFASSNEYDS